MSVWLTEREFRAGASAAQQLTLNVAFLHEIKQDQIELTLIFKEIHNQLGTPARDPRTLFEALSQLRDELETYFALEEFYGYFQSAMTSHPAISQRADRLKSQHESLYVQICDLVEKAEGILYGELPCAKTWQSIALGYDLFLLAFKQHEQQEMELMLMLCNDELGVGD